MKKAVTYARKSYYTGKLSDQEVIGYQQSAMNQYAEQHQLEVVKEFSDVNYTGANVDRPSLQALLHYLSTNKIDQVLFYSVDRMGRHNANNIDLVREMLDHVSSISFVSEGLTFDQNNNTLDVVLLVLFSSQADSFREIHGKKIAAAKEYKLKKYKNFNGCRLQKVHPRRFHMKSP
ncbi:recombinase family protein [Jeotgalibacillus salarius]|uniref:recombinase family protein n=1 Tax=Jeotgalibacillus salarius TaxID=546023 RepID=UPI00141B548A|nr:recombinase family protein [Jeotgalibacillus salarius]